MSDLKITVTVQIEGRDERVFTARTLAMGTLDTDGQMVNLVAGRTEDAAVLLMDMHAGVVERLRQRKPEVV